MGIITIFQKPTLKRGTPWLRAPSSEPHLMEPGSPWHTGHHERWIGVCREGGLHRWLWSSGAEARRIMTNG